MNHVVLALPGNDHLANRIGAFLGLDVSSVTVHRFPDGEARVRINRSVTGKAVILTAGHSAMSSITAAMRPSDEDPAGGHGPR